jgi:hypothetical protein
VFDRRRNVQHVDLQGLAISPLPPDTSLAGRDDLGPRNVVFHLAHHVERLG